MFSPADTMDKFAKACLITYMSLFFESVSCFCCLITFLSFMLWNKIQNSLSTFFFEIDFSTENAYFPKSAAEFHICNILGAKERTVLVILGVGCDYLTRNR